MRSSDHEVVQRTRIRFTRRRVGVFDDRAVGRRRSDALPIGERTLSARRHARPPAGGARAFLRASTAQTYEPSDSLCFLPSQTPPRWLACGTGFRPWLESPGRHLSASLTERADRTLHGVNTGPWLPRRLGDKPIEVAVALVLALQPGLGLGAAGVHGGRAVED